MHYFTASDDDEDDGSPEHLAPRLTTDALPFGTRASSGEAIGHSSTSPEHPSCKHCRRAFLDQTDETDRDGVGALRIMQAVPSWAMILSY